MGLLYVEAKALRVGASIGSKYCQSSLLCFDLVWTISDLCGRLVTASGLSIAVATVVELLAEGPFKSTPRFNPAKRPCYTITDRVHGHARFFRDTVPLFMLDTWLSPSSLEDMPVSRRLSDLEPGTNSYLASYVLLATSVLATLILSDILYFGIHVVQHRFALLSRVSNHGYHHTFRYPLAAAGPWLSPIDMLLSGIATFLGPLMLVLDVCNSYGLMRNRGFYEALLTCYIHEMNHSDHCGKQLPTWSGCPLIPPLGFALGLDRSIPIHESHHNFGGPRRWWNRMSPWSPAEPMAEPWSPSGKIG